MYVDRRIAPHLHEGAKPVGFSSVMEKLNDQLKRCRRNIPQPCLQLPCMARTRPCRPRGPRRGPQGERFPLPVLCRFPTDRYMTARVWWAGVIPARAWGICYRSLVPRQCPLRTWSRIESMSGERRLAFGRLLGALDPIDLLLPCAITPTSRRSGGRDIQPDSFEATAWS